MMRMSSWVKLFVSWLLAPIVKISRASMAGSNSNSSPTCNIRRIQEIPFLSSGKQSALSGFKQAAWISTQACFSSCRWSAPRVNHEAEDNINRQFAFEVELREMESRHGWYLMESMNNRENEHRTIYSNRPLEYGLLGHAMDCFTRGVPFKPP